ncbi:MAG: response regulator transcription factor [Flavitalea sp.]
MQNKTDKISLILVEDHTIFLEGLSSILSKLDYLDITARFADGESALSYINNKSVDLVFLDISLPGKRGPEICSEIKNLNKQTKVIALSNHSEKHIIMEMLGAGANGYLLKNASLPDLENAISLVMQGQMAIPEEIREIVFTSNNTIAGPPKLTKREKEILQLVADGLTTSAIATKLFVSTQTVESHRYNLMKKFEVNNSINLVRQAIEMGLITNS